jgi:hypothetical protein
VFITTVILVAASWYLTFKSNIAFIPYDRFDWWSVIKDTLTLHYAHILTHFLYLYAIFLVLSPILVWLLRRGLWWIGVIASLVLWFYGFVSHTEWMQWQALFYLPAIAGFYLDQIIAFCRRIPTTLIWITMTAGLVSIVVSGAIILPYAPGSYSPEIFSREPLTFARILLSLVWFVSLAWLFNKVHPWMHKYIGWLLLPFGTRSLTAYIVHSFVLTAIAFFIPATSPFWLNTFIACIAILGTWLIVKTPGINRVIPR